MIHSMLYSPPSPPALVATITGGPQPPAGGGAAGGGDGAGPGQQPTGSPGAFDPTFLIVLVGLFAFMMVMSFLSQRKEKRRRSEMLGGLGRHDRVLTSGGVIGTIVELKDDEITLKVDETTNTKIRFSRSAVSSVLRKGRGGDAPAEETIAAADD